MPYSAAIIGTGADPEERDRTGYAMAYRHGPGYQRLENVELVACADIVPENARAFADRFDIPDDHVYEDYERMLDDVDIDIVSVCTPPAVHAEIVVDCAQHGSLAAVHCEKPMATTWADCREMVSVCASEGVQLTIGHQRRFGGPFVKAKELLDDGTVGDLVRIECGEANLFDAGVHQLDLCEFYTGGARATWVIGNVDYREENRWFGATTGTQGLAQWQYEDGTTGLAVTGETDGLGIDIVGCYLRLIGADGVVELGVEDGPSLRYRIDGQGWTSIDTGETIHAPSSGLVRQGTRKILDRMPMVDGTRLDRVDFFERAIAEVVAALEEDREPTISGRRAIDAMELVFGVWESARRRGRVDLPLDIEDNPLEAMIEAGTFEGASEEVDEDTVSKH